MVACSSSREVADANGKARRKRKERHLWEKEAAIFFFVYKKDISSNCGWGVYIRFCLKQMNYLFYLADKANTNLE